MTYYWAKEKNKGYGTGPMGIRDNRLVPFKSVALKGALGPKYFGRTVEIQGMGSYRVDDQCDGPGCKDVDMYVGLTQNGYDGIKPICYKIV